VARSKAEQVGWADADQARAFVYRVMHRIMIDRKRRRSANLGERDAGVASPEDVDVGLRMDLLTALEELDRTGDQGLKLCFQAFKAYYFLNHESRFSREGDEMLSGWGERARTFEQVSKLLGIPRSTAEYRVKKVERWLTGRLRAYDRDGYLHEEGGSDDRP
jgi:hypothetical protein